jgi:hypothetical protein
VEWLAALADALFSRAQGSEVFCRFGIYRFEQFHLDTSGLFAVDLNVEKDAGVVLAGHVLFVTELDQEFWILAPTVGSKKVVAIDIF